MASFDDCIAQLSSKFFPEREKAVQRIQTIAASEGGGGIAAALLVPLEKPRGEWTSWEAQQGALLACAAVARVSGLSIACNTAMGSAAARALTHSEARVRSAAAGLLEPLAAAGPGRAVALWLMLEPVLQAQLVRDDVTGLDQALEALTALVRGGQVTQPGWLAPLLPPTLLAALVACCRHRLTHVREAAFRLVVVLAEAVPALLHPHELEIAQSCSQALGDPNVHVIMAGSQGVRALIQHSADKEALLRELLPAMCLNRYYPAEGLRLYSMESWQQAVGTRGRELLAALLPQTLAYYVSKASAAHPNIREAVTRCLHELVQKLEPAAVRPYVSTIVGQLQELLHDVAWPIRDAAFTACALALTSFPHELAAQLDILWQEALVGISDPLWCVRESAATLLVSTVDAAPARLDQLAKVTSAISQGLDQLRNQPAQAQTHVKKYITPRDRTAARSGGHDSHHQPARVGQPCTHCEPWQLTDGCIYALRELAKRSPEAAVELIPALARVADFRIEFDHAVPLLETVWTEFAAIARSLSTQPVFRRQLGAFVEPLRAATKHPASQVQSAATGAMRLMRELFREDWLKLL